MKTALLLASTLALAGPAVSAAPAAAKGKPTVNIVVDLSRSPIACSVDKVDVSVSKKAKDKVKWKVPADVKKIGYSLKIDWKAENPFAKAETQDPDGDWDSGDIAPNAAEKAYEYGFTLTLKDKRDCKVDPRILVAP